MQTVYTSAQIALAAELGLIGDPLDLGEAAVGRLAIVESAKWEYLFGRVASNARNAARSAENATQLARIGVRDTAEGRALLQSHLNEVVASDSNIIRLAGDKCRLSVDNLDPLRWRLMTYRPFEVPEYHEFIDALGVGPEPVQGEEAQSLRFEVSGDLLVISFDVPGRSLRCRWSRGQHVLVDIFREGAVALRVRSSGESAIIGVEFETDSERGQLEVQVTPAIALRDRLLFR